MGGAALRARRGLTRMIGLAPGPANGFTLDVIGCFERYGELIDWTMLILNPFEPWPGELRSTRPGATRRCSPGWWITAWVFHDDLVPGHAFSDHDHRGFRPEGWVEAGREKLERIRPIALHARAHPAPAGMRVELGASGGGVRRADVDSGGGPPRQADRAQARGAGRGARPACPERGGDLEIRTIGDNRGSMLLEEPRPTTTARSVPIAERHAGTGRACRRFGIDPRGRPAPNRRLTVRDSAAGPRSAAAPRCPRDGPRRGSRRSCRRPCCRGPGRRPSREPGSRG